MGIRNENLETRHQKTTPKSGTKSVIMGGSRWKSWNATSNTKSNSIQLRQKLSPKYDLWNLLISFGTEVSLLLCECGTSNFSFFFCFLVVLGFDFSASWNLLNLWTRPIFHKKLYPNGYELIFRQLRKQNKVLFISGRG